MRITLNLASRPFADLGPAIKRLRIAMGALALVAIGLWTGLHLFHERAEEARASEHSLDASLARLNQERQGYYALMQRPDNAKLLEQTAVLNQLFERKSFSWTLAMESLETVLPGGVQVTRIEPEPGKDGHILLHLQVVGPRDKDVDLVRNLETSRRFVLPRIVGESAAETQSNSPNQRLEPVSASNRFGFDVLAEYNPPTPDERKHLKHKKPAAGTEGGEAKPQVPLGYHIARPPLPGAPQRGPGTQQGNVSPQGGVR
jgi:type IV pilus assembly protein PilN